MTATTERLTHAQRAHSQAALSSAFPPFSALKASANAPEPSGRRRPRASSTGHVVFQPFTAEPSQDSPFGADYSSRGFERDPFEDLFSRAYQREWAARATSISGSAGPLKESVSHKAMRNDDWTTRLGARATAFGGWTDGEGRLQDWSARWGGGTTLHRKPDESSDDEGSDVSDNDSDLNWHAQRAAKTSDEYQSSYVDRPNLGEVDPERRKSSLSVFHDAFEYDDRPSRHTPNSSLPPTPNFSHSRLHSLSSMTSTPASSPQSPYSSLPPMTPTHESVPTSFYENQLDGTEVDAMTHTFLASQDRWGLFALVESFLEWPWASKEQDLTHTEEIIPSSDPNQPKVHASSRPGSSYVTPSGSGRGTPSNPAALSRVASTYSMSSPWSMEIGSLDDVTWSDSGELRAYYRAKSMSDMNKKEEWERDERLGSRRDNSERSPDKKDSLEKVIDVLAGLTSFI